MFFHVFLHIFHGSNRDPWLPRPWLIAQDLTSELLRPLLRRLAWPQLRAHRWWRGERLGEDNDVTRNGDPRRSPSDHGKKNILYIYIIYVYIYNMYIYIIIIIIVIILIIVVVVIIIVCLCSCDIYSFKTCVIHHFRKPLYNMDHIHDVYIIAYLSIMYSL